MSDFMKTYEEWKTSPYFDEETRAELAALTDPKEIEERFYKELEFGTGGLRGILGAGSNRMNKYIIRRATNGFARFLLDKFGEEAKKRGVAVAFDCRNHSREFAKETALSFAAFGIPAYLYDCLSATPLLSFTVRDLDCCGGVVVTASHNPREYNGYKAYDETGCQLGPDDAEAVIERVNSLDITEGVCVDEQEALDKGLLKIIGADEVKRYADTVRKQAHDVPDYLKDDIKIVYTPLHGAGLAPVTYVLEQEGFKNVSRVEAQCVEDGNFPTVDSPNPENASALAMAIEQAKAEEADLVLATDPDSDRIGIAVLHEGEYRLMSGNQTGALLVNYVLEQRRDTLTDRSALITTIVTSEFGADIARAYGLNVFKCLTGFKFIGAIMNGFEKNGDYDFVLGYEESYGYLVGTHARDKDAVVSSMLIAEMTAVYKARGLTLVDVLDSLYEEYGYYLDGVGNYVFKGKSGAEEMKEIMADLRKLGKDLMPGITEIKDYAPGCDGLPKSDVLKYFFHDGSWIAVRPSGTEPKVKAYYGIKGASREQAEVLYEERKAYIDKIMDRD